MKKTIFLHITLLVLLTACQTEKYKARDETLSDYLEPKNPCITYNDIVRIATKYGLQDSITPGYHSIMFQLPDPLLYPYINVAMLDSFFVNQLKCVKSKQDFSIFQQEKFNLKSVAGYYELIESLPSMYQNYLKELGPEGYKKMKAEHIATQDIYMGFDSTISFSQKGDPYEYGRKLNQD